MKLIEANDIVKMFLKYVLDCKDSNIEDEANKIKDDLSDDSLNKLARYTYKTLGIKDDNCSYDINNINCIKCKK